MIPNQALAPKFLGTRRKDRVKNVDGLEATLHFP